MALHLEQRLLLIGRQMDKTAFLNLSILFVKYLTGMIAMWRRNLIGSIFFCGTMHTLNKRYASKHC